MTLRDLHRLLRAIPDDCWDLPVLVERAGGLVPATAVEVNPPEPKFGGESFVGIRSRVDGTMLEHAVLVEYPRAGGPDEGMGLRAPASD